ncbi:hypothetical protein BD311DRAFT_770268 [Dichomitus squalens]|uniref:Uncharacterized protein n=1 Tax=Dichomitus squalens TaxID=114155 RepID=A0A4Q9M6C0_9APHY|nr:hypothetical protein BD311DRAFT_770268 [Dichomitus squalens]
MCAARQRGSREHRKRERFEWSTMSGLVLFQGTAPEPMGQQNSSTPFRYASLSYRLGTHYQPVLYDTFDVSCFEAYNGDLPRVRRARWGLQRQRQLLVSARRRKVP